VSSEVKLKKNSNKQQSLKSFENVNKVLLNIAALQVNADKKENEMNEKILALKKQFEPGIKELNDKILFFEDQLTKFCKIHKKEFTSARSRDLTYGKIGIRTGKPSLKLTGKKITWDNVKEKFKALYKNNYINTETSLNKIKILADAEKGLLSQKQLNEAGCKVVQAESSFYQINWDKIKLENVK
jgi:phage host-nuclease inhibitor protein Gam